MYSTNMNNNSYSLIETVVNIYTIFKTIKRFVFIFLVAAKIENLYVWLLYKITIFL